MTSGDRWSRWTRRLVRLQTAALGAATLGVAVQTALGGLSDWVVPPGLIILGGATTLVLVWRRAVPVAVGVAAAALVAGHIFSRPAALERLGHGVSGAAQIVELGGVVVALLSGGLALLCTPAGSWATQRAAGRSLEWGRWAQVAGLLVLAPVCAEYLAAYDSSTGHPVQLLAGLIVFVPLYGCAALLIREVARRMGLGWVGILLLATAFGLLQAGVVDQSLFSPDYRGIDGWEEGYRRTLIAPLGISVFKLLSFVGGHAVFSIGAPIALVEAAGPSRAGQPWVSRGGLALLAVLYGAASALVLREHLLTEVSHASLAQVAGSLTVVVLLVVAAIRLGGPLRTRSDRPVPPVAVVFGAAVVLAVANGLATETWTGVAVTLGPFALAAGGVAVLARRRGWSLTHVAAVAAAPLLVRAALAFGYAPLVGEVSPAEMHGHHAAMLAIVLGVCAVVWFQRARPRVDTSTPTSDQAGTHAW